MTSAMPALKPRDVPAPSSAADERAKRLIAKSRYQPPQVVSFPIAMSNQVGQYSMIGNSGHPPA